MEKQNSEFNLPPSYRDTLHLDENEMLMVYDRIATFSKEYLKLWNGSSLSQSDNENIYTNFRRQLGIVSPKDLQDGGLDKKFIVVYNNRGNSYKDDGERFPMEMFLAYGSKLDQGIYGGLSIDCVKIATLYHGSDEPKLMAPGTRKMYKRGIENDENVILPLNNQ